MANNGLEVEIKLRVQDTAMTHGKLLSRGFAIVRERVFERNVILDRPTGELAERGELLRLRQVGQQAVLTFKGRVLQNRHKAREEREVHTTDFDSLSAILERVGFSAVFQYEKYRTEYSLAGETGLAMLDETPIGSFLELEGEPEWIDQVARELGYTEEEYLTQSYGALYVSHCQQDGSAPANMVFSDLNESARLGIPALG